MDNYDECMKAIHKFHEDVIKGYLEKPNPKLDESIRNLSDEEFFLLSMLVISDHFISQTDNKPKEGEEKEKNNEQTHSEEKDDTET